MYGQQCRAGTESSAPAAESSRNRYLACGKPRHEVMLGHGSFSNSMSGPRNFVRVALSLDSAWLPVQSQHRISPHLFSGTVISILSLPFPKVFPASPHVFCSAQAVTECLLSPTQSVTLCSEVLSFQDEQAVTGQ